MLAAIDSADSFDGEKRKAAFSAWQEYAKEEAFVIPTLYRNQVLPVSQRVTGLDWSHDNYDLWSKIGVSEDTRK